MWIVCLEMQFYSGRVCRGRGGGGGEGVVSGGCCLCDSQSDYFDVQRVGTQYTATVQTKTFARLYPVGFNEVLQECDLSHF